MTSDFKERFKNYLNGDVVIVTGTLPQDLKAACVAMTHFHGCGFEVKTSNLTDTTFLYTLTLAKEGYRKCPDTCDHKNYLQALNETPQSANFSVTKAQYC